MDPDITTVAARAIAWAEDRRGSTAYATRCLAFVEDAVERANELEVFGGDDAAATAELFHASDRTDPPPRGAFAFYSAIGEIAGRTKDWGHVGLSLGHGLVIHAWDRVRVDDHRELESLRPAPAWSAPRWIGWVPLETILATARPHRWPAGETAEEAARRDQQHMLRPRASDTTEFDSSTNPRR
ncbi:hypothetical protein QE411_001233 [Microbacterium arborescens]|nr:hypothetical protein [Microbacterium arborescens]